MPRNKPQFFTLDGSNTLKITLVLIIYRTTCASSKSSSFTLYAKLYLRTLNISIAARSGGVYEVSFRICSRGQRTGFATASAFVKLRLSKVTPVSPLKLLCRHAVPKVVLADVINEANQKAGNFTFVHSIIQHSPFITHQSLHSLILYLCL